MIGRRTAEDYLKTIYVLSMTQEVHGCMIAKELGISRPTVSVFLRRLEMDGYLKVNHNKAVTLTEQGLEIARPVFERYSILRNFLTHLGVSPQEANRDACEMEHGLGEESYQALKNLAEKLENDQ